MMQHLDWHGQPYTITGSFSHWVEYCGEHISLIQSLEKLQRDIDMAYFVGETAFHKHAFA